MNIIVTIVVVMILAQIGLGYKLYGVNKKANQALVNITTIVNFINEATAQNQ